MKKYVNVWDYAGAITGQLDDGVLLTTKADGKVNTMTIGWGFLGVLWGKPVFTVLVRKSRYTMELLEKNPEFTVNIPLGAYDKKIIGVCGTASGRDTDKIADLHLTPEEPDTVSVPAIKELPLTLECKVIYKQPQDPGAIPESDMAHYYGKGTKNEEDYHTAYYGLITKAYIVE